MRSVVCPLLVVLLIAAGCTTPPDADEGDQPSSAAVPPPDDAEPGGGTLRVGLSLDPVSIDPRFVADDEGEVVVGALFEPLVTLDRRLEVVPAAARRWEVLDEGRRLVFHLRPATFHDGTPVTAGDFVRSFTRLLDGTAEPRSYLGYLLEPVEGAQRVQEYGGAVSGLRAVDERTLEIRLASAQPGFLRVLADPSLVPVPPTADDDLEAFAAQPIGNGPFAMTEPREPGQFLRLTRYGDHHRAPELDEVVFSVYPDTGPRESQWDDLIGGQLHVAQVPPERLDEARRTFGTSSDGYTGPGVLDGLTSTVYLYGFDTTMAPFDDVRVRRALSLSIDRERLARQVLAGSRVAAFGIVPPPVPGSQARACAYCRHDPEQARALWAEVAADHAAAEASEADEAGSEGDVEAGEGEAAEDADATEDGSAAEEPPASGDAPAEDGSAAEEPPASGDAPAEQLDDDAAVVPPSAAPDEPEADAELPAGLARITLTHNRGRTHSAVAARMADDIEAALGITVDLEALDLAPFLQRVRNGETGAFRLGWESGTPDPGAYLVPLFHSAGVGLDNLTRYADAAVDALLEEAQSLEPPAAARARYREAERLILQDQPVLPLLWYRQSRIVAPGVEGLRWAPFGRVDLAAVSLSEG